MAQFIRAAFVLALLFFSCCAGSVHDSPQEYTFEEVDASVDAHATVATSSASNTGNKKVWNPFRKKVSVLKPFAHGSKNAKAFKAMSKHSSAYKATGRSPYMNSVTSRSKEKEGPGPYVSTDARTGASGHYYLGNNRRRIGAGFGRRRRSAAKKARCVTFKTWRAFRKHKMIAAAMKRLPKNPCNKKELDQKIVKHKKEKAAKARQEVRGKERGLKHSQARSFRNKASHSCKLTNGRSSKAVRAMQRAMQKVTAAKNAAKRLCDAQKRANERARKEKKLLQIKGPTFKFKPSQPCKGGLGTFTKPLVKDRRVNVGVVPTGMANVKIELQTDKDLDAEIWTKDSKTAIIAWKCALHNNNHLKVGKVKDMCIDSADKITKKWKGNRLQYSGWLGKQGKHGRKFGHEDIKVLGRNNMPFMMKTYAYEAGTARVKYSWGVNRKRCEAHKAMARKERKAKYDAKRAAKRALKEKDYKAVLKVLYASVRFCSSAKKLAKKARKELAQAKVASSRLKKAVAACTLKVHHASSRLAVACLKHKCSPAIHGCSKNKKCRPMIKCLNACPASKRRSATKKCLSHCLIPHSKQKVVKRLGRCGHHAKCWSTRRTAQSKKRRKKSKKSKKRRKKSKKSKKRRKKSKKKPKSGASKKKPKSGASCKSEWKCLPGISTPVRLDPQSGHVSCMSSQGKHCWWGRCRGSKVPRHPKKIARTSLICGAHHKSKWGGTGYNAKGHWCNNAKKGLGFTGKPCRPARGSERQIKKNAKLYSRMFMHTSA